MLACAAPSLNRLDLRLDQTPAPAPDHVETLRIGLLEAPAVPETLAQVADRADDWYRSLKPRDEFHAWLVNQVTVLSLRVDRCQRVERRLRDRHSLRAATTWDLDRRHQAEALGSRLARRPGEVVAALRRTPQGCDWLIHRWALLAQAADAQGGWTPEQSALAFDLLGTPAAFRAGAEPGAEPGAGPDPEGPAALARRQIAALGEVRAAAAGLDEVDRALARADLSDEANPELGRLRRHESALFRRIRWCVEQLKYQSPHAGPGPGIRPRWSARPGPAVEPMPAPAPEPAPGRLINPHPPFDLEPDEDPGPGRLADIPRILSARRAKRERKAQARREARRRKLERLRT